MIINGWLMFQILVLILIFASALCCALIAAFRYQLDYAVRVQKDTLEALCGDLDDSTLDEAFEDNMNILNP